MVIVLLILIVRIFLCLLPLLTFLFLARLGGWFLFFLILVLLLLRAGRGLSPRRPPLRPKALGFRELGWGLATLVLLALGYRLGV